MKISQKKIALKVSGEVDRSPIKIVTDLQAEMGELFNRVRSLGEETSKALHDISLIEAKMRGVRECMSEGELSDLFKQESKRNRW